MASQICDFPEWNPFSWNVSCWVQTGLRRSIRSKGQWGVSRRSPSEPIEKENVRIFDYG